MNDPTETTVPQPLEGLPPAPSKRNTKSVEAIPDAFFRYLGTAGASILNRYGTWSLAKKDDVLHKHHPVKKVLGKDVDWFANEHSGLFTQLTTDEATAFEKAVAQATDFATKKEG